LHSAPAALRTLLGIAVKKLNVDQLGGEKMHSVLFLGNAAVATVLVFYVVWFVQFGIEWWNESPDKWAPQRGSGDGGCDDLAICGCESIGFDCL
jgi:hypothetical protein